MTNNKLSRINEIENTINYLSQDIDKIITRIRNTQQSIEELTKAIERLKNE